MMNLKPYDSRPAIGKKTGVDKIVIGKSVLNQKCIKEFIEHMKAQGYNVQTTEDGVEITGDNLDADAHLAELVKHFTPVDEHTKQFLFEKYGIEVI